MVCCHGNVVITRGINQWLLLLIVAVGRWSASGEGSIRLGGSHLLCPICRENLSTEDIQSHLIKELKELSQL